MNSIANLPPIICSSCGSFVGHKYLQYREYVANGYSKLDTFESLSIRSYCCRMIIENPIVVSTNYGCEATDKEDSRDDDNGKLIKLSIESDIKYFDTLTKELKIVKTKTPTIDLKDNLRKALSTKREYKPPCEKDMNLDIIHEESIVVDSVRKIRKVYIASHE